jgi:hypothetical protein
MSAHSKILENKTSTSIGPDKIFGKIFPIYRHSVQKLGLNFLLLTKGYAINPAFN